MKNIKTVAKYTLLEIFRSKIGISTIFLGMALVVIVLLSASLTYGTASKVALDIGLGLCSLSNVGIGIIFGSNLIAKEIETRTLYMILSRGIRRSEFLFGKILGLVCYLFINSAYLSMVTFLLFKYLGGEIQPLFWWVLFFIFVEALIVLLVSIFFSLITTNVLAGFFTLAVFIAGHALSATSKLLFAKGATFATLIKFGSWILPNLSLINFKDFILYKQNVDQDLLYQSLGYSSLYCVAIAIFISLLFERKNLD